MLTDKDKNDLQNARKSRMQNMTDSDKLTARLLQLRIALRKFVDKPDTDSDFYDEMNDIAQKMVAILYDVKFKYSYDKEDLDTEFLIFINTGGKLFLDTIVNYLVEIGVEVQKTYFRINHNGLPKVNMLVVVSESDYLKPRFLEVYNEVYIMEHTNDDVSIMFMPYSDSFDEKAIFSDGYIKYCIGSMQK